MPYKVTIGLEVHVQVRTKTKMFCGCPNEYGAAPNTSVCPICLGYPGVLPVPNETAIHRTILAGLMCGCAIARHSKFDRKSYFYPDMPKNYQISQYDLPLCTAGKVEISGRGLSREPIATKEIRITRIHLEEDVGKSQHFPRYSGIDFNRAGVPLMEIVSEPDMESADEAYAYLTALKQTMQYADISDCDMEKGQMRCDVNISLAPIGATTLNNKTEVKNVNSFKAAHRAVQYEIERQTELLDNGGSLAQETRGWNDDRGETYVLRTKESAHDYRYFPEPDLMPMQLSDELLQEIRASAPTSPRERRQAFVRQYAIPEYDAGVLTQDQACADYFETCVKLGGKPKKISNWIMAELLREISQAGIPFAASPIQPAALVSLLNLVDNGTINGKIAKTVFEEMFASGKAPDVIVEERGLVQVTDHSEIDQFVQQAIDANPGPAQELRDGKEKALHFLVGQVMKLSGGKANPQLVREAIRGKVDIGK